MLATQNVDAIINQLKCKPTTHNLCRYIGCYKGNKVAVERQRDNPEAPVDDMNKETDGDKRELPLMARNIEAYLDSSGVVVTGSTNADIRARWEDHCALLERKYQRLPPHSEQSIAAIAPM